MKKFLFGLFALGLMTSCVKEAFVVETQQNTPDFVVTATVEETPATRTQLTYDNGYKTIWSAGDAINVNNAFGSFKFVLTQGAGTPNATFANDPTYSGASAGTEDGNTFPGSGMVAVYPFNANATTSMEGEDVVVNTEIPANQTFSAGSFGQNASPMVAYNVAGLPQFSFKNVGTILCMPLAGEGTIVSAKLESASGVKIAGAATVTAVAENDFIPTTTVTEAGVSTITLSCGEGVELSAEPTKFYFVLAPGTYEENDLVVTFTNSYGDFFQTTIPATLEYKRSEINTFKAREFEAQGTEELDLWVKAQAGVYMNVERIIPSVDNLNVEAWVKDLMNKSNALALIEEALLYVKDGKYDLAFDVLNGIPGFVREYLRLEATGSAIKQVTYGVGSYLDSMLDGIQNINDIESLLAFLEAFEEDYEAYGLKTKLNNELGSIADNFNTYIDAFVESQIKKPEEINPEEAYTAYVTTLKSQLNESKTSGQRFLDLINGINSTFKKSYLSGELDQIEAHIAGIDAVLAVIDNYTYEQVAELQALVDEIPDVEIKAQVISNPTGFIGKGTISTVNAFAGYELINKQGQVIYTIDSSSVFSGEEKDYLSGLLGQIAQNEALIAAAKATLNSAIDDIKGYSLVESLQVAVNEPNSTTGLVLNYLFSQEAFMTSLKTTLHDLVAEIEAAAKEDVNNGNIDAKTKAINETKVDVIKDARKAAIAKVNAQLESTNQANLTGGAWGVFKKVLNWETCVKLFTEAGLLDVYDALCNLTAIVDNMIAFESTDVQFDIVEFSDYQQNVDWWVLTFPEEF